MTSFQQLGLSEPILRALGQKGYDTPTPIQRDAIPALLDGSDLLGIAQTGTGKTAAFALPSLQHLAEHRENLRKRHCRMLVLAPTRELAAQIAANMRGYASNLKLSVELAFGGVPISKQIRALKDGCDVLVATPGRLLDLIDNRALSLDDVEIFVLDEADHMLDLGFIQPLTRIARLLPKQRQSLFFSATMPKSIAQLSKQFLDNPKRVEVAPQSTTAERVDQFASFVDQGEKQSLLSVRLREWESEGALDRALVFTRTKHGADRVLRHLVAAGIPAAAIHGNKSQGQRNAALDSFRSGKTRVLVATDIAARGIDVTGVSHVINFELPNVAEQYVHRIGRTARAGAEGVAFSFVAPDERQYLKAIERLIDEKVAVLPLPENFRALADALPKPKSVRSFKSDMAAGGENRSSPRSRPGGGNRSGSGGRPGGKPGGRNPHKSGGERRAAHGENHSGSGGGHRYDGASAGRSAARSSVGRHKHAVKRQG